MIREIAFDASSFHHTRFDGLNRYTGELLKIYRACDRFQFYTADTQVTPNFASSNVTRIPYSNIYQNNFKNNLLRLIWHQFNLPIQVLKNKQKLFYSPVFEGMLLPVCPQIITIHDVLPIRFPEVYPRIKYYFQYILPRLIRASTAIVTTSEYTKQEILDVYCCHNTPIHVVYQGYRQEIFHAKPQPQITPFIPQHQLQNFILCVGETRPYKNLRRLIEAFARANLPDTELAIVGNINKCDRNLINYPRELGCQQRVKFLGFVPDDELADLYRHATAFAFPSLYEGFGIPPLEAMACGCPVIASTATAIPEVCGDAAYPIDPRDTDDIANALTRVVTDAALRQQLRQRGLERVKSFSYQQMSDRILSILLQYLP